MKDKVEVRGGFYFKDKKVYLRVTKPLEIIDKIQLRYWYGKQVYLAMVADPSLSEEEALHAPYKKMKDAQERGTAVHKLVEDYVPTKEYLETIDPKYKGYLRGYKDFLYENNATIIKDTKTFFCDCHHLAGTLDEYIEYADGSKAIIDIKTGKDIYIEAFLQASAYRHLCLVNGIKIDKVGILQLTETGGKRFESKNEEEVVKLFEKYLTAKSLYEFKYEEMLTDVGYL